MSLLKWVCKSMKMQKCTIRKRIRLHFIKLLENFCCLVFWVILFFFPTFFDPLPNCQKNMLMEYINKEDWGTMALNLVDIFFNLHVNYERSVHTFITILII